MAYKKVITYGNIIEVQEYERDLPKYTDEQKEFAVYARKQNLVANRKNETRRQKFNRTKRQDNARRTANAFIRKVIANFGQSDFSILVTLTYSKNEISPKKGYSDFKSFARSVVRNYGKQVRYIAVPEFQKSGRLHFHALFWGLPSLLVKRERKTREFAFYWKRGFVDLKLTDSSDRVAYYLSKYMKKGFLDFRLFGHRSYLSSRNLVKPVIDTSPILFQYLFSSVELLTSYEFLTSYLGRCVISKYRKLN